MSKLSILYCILLLGCMVAGPSLGAGPAKMKFVQAVYVGDQEIGLKYPEGVACTNELVIVADTANNRLVRYTFNNQAAEPVGPEMPIISPLAVQINSKGEIYALDGRDKRIRIFNPDGTEKGSLSPKGSPVSRKLMPRSFKIDQNDKVYILDLADGLVLVLDAEGNYLRHVPFPGQAGFFSDLAVDGQGNIFLVDSTEVAVYHSGPDADGFELLSKGLKEYANFPTGIAIDKGGTIYLVDKHGGSLVMLNRDGSFLGHKFGYGWKDSQFYYPSQLCISEGGTFVIADRGNSRVQIFVSEE